jgi:hypothetical protein
MKTMYRSRQMTLGNARAGNTLLVAVLLLAVLSLVAATVLQTLSNRYDYSQKAVGWSEALNAAEAGANFGFAGAPSGEFWSSSSSPLYLPDSSIYETFWPFVRQGHSACSKSLRYDLAPSL